MKKFVVACSALVLISSHAMAQETRKGGLRPIQIPPASTGPITPENNPDLFGGRPSPVSVPPASTGPITPENNPDLFGGRPSPVSVPPASTGPITPENNPDLFGKKPYQPPVPDMPTTGPVTPDNHPNLFVRRPTGPIPVEDTVTTGPITPTNSPDVYARPGPVAIRPGPVTTQPVTMPESKVPVSGNSSGFVGVTPGSAYTTGPVGPSDAGSMVNNAAATAGAFSSGTIPAGAVRGR